MDKFFGTDTLITIRKDIKKKLSIEHDLQFDQIVQKEVIEVIKVPNIPKDSYMVRSTTNTNIFDIFL
jgi:hypothetical protein